ncbi:MAG: HAD hydrolase-like protein [Spirochaetales bacterium]|nr:HAD hydrolase-like protein [Leptospiraceae bacterium]MCP5480379.1 HAD hydrolase-like protein [Spirochaetales bacterium]
MRRVLPHVRHILWDVDGTIFSSEEIIHEIYREAFEAHRAAFGRPAHLPDLEAIINEIGKPVRVIFENLAPDLETTERERLSLTILHRLVLAIGEGRGHYYAGMVETLGELAKRGFRFYAASNGRYPYIEAILRKAGILGLFSDVVSVDGRLIHDKNQLVLDILKRHQIDRSRAALVGDRASDRDAALQAELPFVACAYGHGSAPEWQGAVCTVQSPEELLEVFSADGSG